MKQHGVWVSLVVLAATGCGLEQSETKRIALAGTNESGVTALEIDRYAENSDQIFELRGLDSDGNEVAKVRSRIGVIAEVADYLPTSDASGSEMILSIGSFETRRVSREVNMQTIFPTDAPAMQTFLELRAVSAALESEGHLIVLPVGHESELANPYPCNSNQLNVTPTAGQCCFKPVSGTVFINPAGHDVYRTGPRTACRSSSGGSCNGTDCYIGPNGFSKPWVSASTGMNVYVNAQNNCEAGYSASEFSDVTGSFANGQGCPGGNTGAGEWDY